LTTRGQRDRVESARRRAVNGLAQVDTFAAQVTPTRPPQRASSTAQKGRGVRQGPRVRRDGDPLSSRADGLEVLGVKDVTPQPTTAVPAQRRRIGRGKCPRHIHSAKSAAARGRKAVLKGALETAKLRASSVAPTHRRPPDAGRKRQREYRVQAAREAEGTALLGVCDTRSISRN